MTRVFDFSQAANKGYVVLPDASVTPVIGDLVTVSSITGGAVRLSFVGAPATTVAVGDVPPTGAHDSTLWWDSAGTGLYIRYNDGTSTQWVVAENQNTLIDAPSDTTTYGRRNGAWVNLVQGFLPLGGGILTGALTLNADPSGNLHAATKHYVDVAISGVSGVSGPPTGAAGGDLGGTYPNPTVTKVAGVSGPFLPLVSGGAMTGPLVWTSTGTTAPRAAQDRTAEIVNVRDYGAVGNGTTDDTAAINAAIAYCRTLYNSNTAWALTFPTANYLVTGPLNFTSLNRAYIQGGEIDGRGSLIIAKMTGGIVVDCTDSRFLHIHDLTIRGDATTTPKIGLQLAIATNSADYITLTNVRIWGSFTFAAFYNFGSEVFGATSCYMANDKTGANAFVAVEDGINHWHASSTFVSITAPVETSGTFKGHVWTDCAFQGVGTSGVIWLGGAEEYRMVGCYASNTTASTNIFTLYNIGDGSPAFMSVDLDCHIETNAVTYCFVATAASGTTFWQGYDLSFRDHMCSAQTALFRVDPASSITFAQLVELDLWVIAFGPGSPTLVDTPSKWSIIARRLALSSSYYQAGLARLWGPVVDLTNGGTVVLPITQRVVAATGGSVTVTQNGGEVYLMPAATIAAFTVTLPTAPRDGQQVRIFTSYQITSLTIAGNTGQTVSAQPGTLAANTSVAYRYDAGSAMWLAFGSFLSTAGGVVAGTTIFNGPGTALQVTNNAYVGSTLAAGGNLTVGSGAGNFFTLTPGAAPTNVITLGQGGTGGFDLAGNANVDGSLGVGGISTFTGNSTFSGTLTVNGAGNALSVANQLVAGTAAFASSVYIGYAGAAAGLILNTNAGIGRTITFSSATNSRWLISVNNVAEGGSNAGSDFSIDRYTDAGAYIASPVVINRASGLVTIGAGGLTLQGQQSLPIPAAAKGGTSYTVVATDCSLVLTPTGTFTLTLPTAASSTGRIIRLKLTAAFAVNSASSNIVQLVGGAATAAIMPATAGKFCLLQSDGTAWQLMQAN